MSPLVSLICICLAVANAKPFYVVPTAYTTNYATPYVFTQPKEFTGTQYRSFFPVQYVTGDVSNFPVTTKSETPFTFKTPVIATADTPFTFKTPVVSQPQVAFPFKTPVIAQPDTTFVFKTPVNTPETTFTYNTPVAQPFVPTFKSVITPFAPSVTRYHAQNTDGSYTFGYSGGPSSRAETRDTFGRVNGVFNYVDPKGEVQTQQYVADNNGFRVAGTNLPVAPFAKTTGTESNVVAVSRKKREANEEFKTPASTVPLKKVYTPNYEATPTFVYPQTAIPSARASFTYPFNFYPNAYTVPATPYVQDNTIARSFNTENIPFGTTTDTKTFTGKSQPTFYSSTYPFFTYAPTNFVAGRNTPTVYSSTFPYTTFTNTNFDNTFTNKFVKPTTGFSYVY